MKTLILLRHAKSGWDDGVTRDVDRPLNEKGERAARAIGKRLAADGVRFDHVVASPAARVRGTLAQLWIGYGAEPAVQFDERLYLASPETIADVIAATPDAADRLLVVGHNPGLEDFVLGRVRDDGGVRADVEQKFPTASVATLELAIDRWSAIGDAPARLISFVRPRDLDPALGPDL